MLGIPRVEPPKPTKPTKNDIIAGPNKCTPVHSYIMDLHPNVVFRLSRFLHDHPEIALREPLAARRTPGFDGGTSGPRRDVPTTFKEPWNMANCLKSIKTSQMYEAALTFWQFDSVTGVWRDARGHDVDLGVDAITWQSVMACDGLWSKEALKSSACDGGEGRFIFPATVLTAITSIEDIEELIKKEGFFRGLPVLAGQSLMWSLLIALGDTLDHLDEDPTSAELQNRIVKLYEASVTVTGRMRLDPSSSQMILDQMIFIDNLRILNVAVGAASCFEWILHVWKLLGGSDPNLTCQALLPRLTELGVQFKGKAVDRGLGYAIMAVVGVADKDPGMAAVRFVERISPGVLASETKLTRAWQVIKKICPGEDLHDACRMVMESIGVAILSGDEAADNFVIDFLTPKEGKKKGYVHTSVRKMGFKNYIIKDAESQAQSGATNGALTCEGVSNVRSKFSSPLAFWENFSEEISQDRAK